MKILMHEGSQKFGLRGQMALERSNSLFEMNVSAMEKQGAERLEAYYHEGRYENEVDFKNMPKVFLEFAVNKWKELYAR
ncbi:MAG: hypothetical protein P8Q42_06680 [Flavobacteriales bacterium]|nr:hypothetical protein [Flavobacteriales bacterium]